MSIDWVKPSPDGVARGALYTLSGSGGGHGLEGSEGWC
jgi:hypothetical protein